MALYIGQIQGKDWTKRAKSKMAGTGNVGVIEDEENVYTGTRVRPFDSTPRQFSQILLILPDSPFLFLFTLYFEDQIVINSQNLVCPFFV